MSSWDDIHPMVLRYYIKKKGSTKRKHSKKLFAAFTAQRLRAEKRGIEFLFTFDEWCDWWEKHLGKDWVWKRGSFANQYVMARYYDSGAYAPHNVKCITASENIREIKKNKKVRV